MPSDGIYFRRLLLTAILLVIGIVVWLTIRVWLAIFAGILIAVFLTTLTEWVSKVTKLKRTWALLVVIVLMLGLIVLAGWLIAPQVAQQFSELGSRVPEALDHLRQKLSDWGWSRFLPQKMPTAAELSSTAGKLATHAGQFFTVSVGAIATFFAVLFLGIYIAASPYVYRDGIVKLFPQDSRNRVRAILDSVGKTLGHWLLGQMLSMAIVGTLIGVGLTILGVPLGLALGVLAGLFNFIPIIGSLISALPAVLLGFLVSPMHPVYVIVVYFIVNTGIESHLLVPLIQKYAVKLPPAIAVASLLLMGELFGFLGLLLAIPMAATLLVLIQKVYVEDILGDRDAATTRTAAPQ